MINFVFAQTERELGTLEGLGPLGKFSLNIGSATDLFNKVLSNIIGFMTVIAGIWFIFSFIIGAFGWLTAGGDKAKVQSAQGKMMTAVVGLAVVVAAIFLIELVSSLLGLDVLSPGEFIRGFWD